MTRTRRVLTVSGLSFLAFFLAWCGRKEPPKPAPAKTQAMQGTLTPPVTRAVAVVNPTTGNSAKGLVVFTKVPDGIEVVADMSGLSPGKHAFHVHEFGDCSGPEAKTAGGHFNPEGNLHGAPTDVNRHAGDLGNITADENGTAHYEITDDVLAFEGTNSIIGRAVIVHAGEDDFKTQPSGNAGARIACGVIGIAK